MVERRTENPGVGSSTLPPGTSLIYEILHTIAPSNTSSVRKRVAEFAIPVTSIIFDVVDFTRTKMLLLICPSPLAGRFSAAILEPTEKTKSPAEYAEIAEQKDQSGTQNMY